MENRELIEKYLDRSLTPEEKEAFSSQYRDDDAFRSDLGTQARLLVALRVDETVKRREALNRRRSFGKRGVFIALGACAAIAAAILVVPVLFDGDGHGDPSGPELLSSDGILIEADSIVVDPTENEGIIFHAPGKEDEKLAAATEERAAEEARRRTDDGAEAPTGAEEPELYTPTAEDAPMRASGGDVTEVRTDGMAETGGQRAGDKQAGEIERLTAMFIDGVHTVLWRAVEGKASIFVYSLDDGTRTEVKNFTKHNYDLNRGEFPLDGIDPSLRYEFVIRRTGMPDVTLELSF